MVNQQLKDYVSAQMKAGVTKEGIRKALLEAGWYEAEVQEALQTTGAVSAPAVTKDIVQPKTISFAAPATTQKPVLAGSAALLAASSPSVSSSASAGRSSAGKWVLGGVLVIVLAASGVLYAKNNTLDSQVGSLSDENGVLKTQLAATAKDRNDLASQTAFLKDEKAALDSQLSILLPKTTGEQTASIRGSVGAAPRGIYTITTDRGLVVTIKNSTDTKIAAIFKEIVGAVITVSGPHVAGTREITVTAVNGMPLASSPSSVAP